MKKIISTFVHLIPGAFIFLLLSLIARRWWPRLCGTLSIIICCALIAGSAPTVSNFFIDKLENQFSVLREAPSDTALILVLGSGHTYVENRPPNSVLSAVALSRLTEGVRLWKTQPDAYLAVSGASFGTAISHAQALQSMALELGVPDERLVLFDQTHDTAEEIAAALNEIKDLAATGVLSRSSDSPRERLVITTSATHVPRAAMLIKHQNAIYTMAPTDFLTSDTPWYRLSGGNLNSLDRVLHEWVGMAWNQLRKLLD